MHGQQLGAEPRGAGSAHGGDIVAVAFQVGAECVQLARLGAKEPAGADVLGQRLDRFRAHALGHQHAGAPQGIDRACGVGPGRALDEDGADHRLERRLARPPALWPVLFQEELIDAETLGHDTSP